jgi:hypothetical protein
MVNEMFLLSKLYYDHFHSSDMLFVKKKRKVKIKGLFICRVKLKLCEFSTFHKIVVICREFYSVI